MKYAAIRRDCRQANRCLPETGLVDLTFGNVSVADVEEGVFAIKPSGVPYGGLEDADMVVVRLADGSVAEGSLRPSSDAPTHRRLLQAFAESGVRAVVHTHSRNAVAFAQAGRSIPCLGTTHADYFYGEIPVTRRMAPEEIAEDYEWNTGKVILEAMEGGDPLEKPGMLVFGHGPFAWGETASRAVENAQALEIAAALALKTLALDPQAPPLPKPLLEKHFRRKHGVGAYYGQERH